MNSRILLAIRTWILISTLLAAAVNGFAQSRADAANVPWRKLETLGLPSALNVGLPTSFAAFQLDRGIAKRILSTAPKEHGPWVRARFVEFPLPMPDGTVSRFEILEAPVVQKGLSDKFPQLRTYSGRGIDDPTATARFDFIDGTFRAMISGRDGAILVEPFPSQNETDYISFFLRDVPEAAEEFWCPVGGGQHEILAKKFDLHRKQNAVIAGDVLSTYVIAIGTTSQWTSLMGGGTVAGGLARVVSILNRINLIYERDAAMRFILAADNANVIFVGSSPYNNNDIVSMASNNTNILRTRLNNGYDIGHAFGTSTTGSAAGVALGIGISCTNDREKSASKITSEFGFDLLTPVHEIGHQMGAAHTFNKADQRFSDSAFEPGAGVSIMSHGVDGSMDSFHVRSIEQIVEFSQSGFGSICSDQTATGNTAPSVSAATGFNIPKGTPFSLTAAASDIDGDSLTYDWQEYDLGAISPPDNDLDGLPRPIFRVYSPTISPTRFFPSLNFIRNNSNIPPPFSQEILPSITRTMNFQVVVRDNQAGTGGVNTALATVNVDGDSGPFILTAPNGGGSDFESGGTMLVEWNVANTTNGPVKAANVDIRLSTDGGLTFPITLAEATANDGSETVTLPALVSPVARIMVIGDENIFFDISDQNISIADCEAGECPALSISPPASNIPRGGGIGFTSAGGSGAHNFSILVNESLATIDPSSGQFVAGPGVGTDIVRVTDSLGATADAIVTTVAACLAGERTWDGGGASSNWSDAANWTCDEVPESSGEVVIFDFTSQKNATIDVDTTVAQFRIDTGFTGAITIADGVDVTTTQDGGFIQADGTINAGSGTITVETFLSTRGLFIGGSGDVVVHKEFKLDGGSFSLTTGNLDIHRVAQATSGFGADGGTVRVVGDQQGNVSISQVNNLTIDASVPKLFSGTSRVFGDLRLVNGGMINGTVSVAGGMIVESTYQDDSTGGSPATIVISGNGSGNYINNGGVTPRGPWTVDGFISLASDLDLSTHAGGSLRLTSGRIIGGSFIVNAGTRNIVRTNGHIQGGLRRDFSTTGDKSFPLGLGSSFSPVTVSVIAPIAGTNGVTVQFAFGTHPSMNLVTSLECHWNLTEHGNITANLTFIYPNNCDSFGIEADASVARIAGGNVQFTGDQISTSTNTFTVLGETEFVSYSIGIDPSPCPSGLRTWDGGGLTNNWSEAGNWACDLVPQNGNNILFDDTSTKDVVIDTPLNAGSFQVRAGYPGTITLPPTDTTIRDFTQENGTFAGAGGAINITGVFSKTGGSFTAGGGAMTVAGTFTHTSGNFDAGAGPLSITGVFTQSGGAIIASGGATTLFSNFRRSGGTFAHNNGTVEFRGSASTINQGLPVSTVESFNNLTIQKTSIQILRLTGTLRVAGNLNLSSGQLLPDVTGSKIELEGNATVSANFNGLTPLNHVGTQDQTIFSDQTSTTPWADWTIDKPGGKVALLTNLRFASGNRTVIFRNGLLETGAFVLDLGDSNSFSENGYVVGNLRKRFFSSGVFEVGTASGPAFVSIEGGLNFGVFTVRANDGFLADVDEARSISRNWTISSDGTLATQVTFNYNDSDVPAGADESAFRLIRRDGLTNTEFVPTILDTGANIVTLSDLINFSDWTVGRNLAPIAAPASVSGRVLDSAGRGIRNAVVTVQGSDGVTRSVSTNTFGYYRINDLAAGDTYVLSVAARRHRFANPSRVIQLFADLTDENFVADPP